MSYDQKVIRIGNCCICNSEMPITNRASKKICCSKKCSKERNNILEKLNFPNRKKLYYLNNKEKIKHRTKMYYYKNKKIIDYKIKGRIKANPEKYKKLKELTYEKHKQKYTQKRRNYYFNVRKKDKEAMQRQVILQRLRRATQKGKEKMKQENKRRRFSKHIWYIRSNGLVVSDKLKMQLIENLASKNKCYYCGSKRNLSIDHIAPISKYNLNEIWNFLIACGSCNSTKTDKEPFTWSKEINRPLPQYFIINFQKFCQ